MKIKDLIDQLSQLNSELRTCVKLIEALKSDGRSERTMEICVGGGSFRAKCNSEYMMAALAAQAKDLEIKIAPLQKKFDAIELMLEA